MSGRQPTPEQRIRSHAAAQTVMILFGGAIWYGACLEATSAAANTGLVDPDRDETLRLVDPSTVLALLGLALAVGIFGRQPRSISALEHLAARVDAGAAEVSAVFLTVAATASTVRAFAGPSTSQARQLAVGVIALTTFLAWRVSWNRVLVMRDGRDAAREQLRRQNAEFDRERISHPARCRSIGLTMTVANLVITSMLLATLTGLRLFATGDAAIGPDCVAALAISLLTLVAGIMLRTSYVLAVSCHATMTRCLIIAFAAATPVISVLGVVSATSHHPAARAVGMTLIAATLAPPFAVCTVRRLGGEAVTALAVHLAWLIKARRNAALERLFDAFDAVTD